MKKLFLPLLLALCCSACLISCKKNPSGEKQQTLDKLDTCKFHHYYLRPLGIAFSGFSATDLDTVVRLRYSGGSHLNDLLSTDTFVNADSSFFLVGDTLFLKHDSSAAGYFWLLEDEIDYRVILPSINTSYVITGTSKGPEYTTYQAKGCLDRSDVLPLQNTHVDGEPVYPSQLNFDAYTRYIFIKR